MLKYLRIVLVGCFLIGCDAKPIDYDKIIHKSSYVRAGSAQTGRLYVVKLIGLFLKFK